MRDPGSEIRGEVRNAAWQLHWCRWLPKEYWEIAGKLLDAASKVMGRSLDDLPEILRKIAYDIEKLCQDERKGT